MNKLQLLSISLLMVSPLVASDNKPSAVPGGAMSRMGTRVTARAQTKADAGRKVQSPTALLDAAKIVAPVNPDLAKDLREEAVTKITPQGRISAAQQKAAPEVAQQNMQEAKNLADQAFKKYPENKPVAQALWTKAEQCWATAQLATVKITAAVPYELQELLTSSLEQAQGFAIREEKMVDANNDELVNRFSILQLANDTQDATAATEVATQPANTRGKETRMAVAGVLAKFGAKGMAKNQYDKAAEKYDSATAAWQSAQLVCSDAEVYLAQLEKVIEKSNTSSSYYQDASFQLAVHYMRQAGRLHKTAPHTAQTIWNQAKKVSTNVDDQRKPALDAMLNDSFENFIAGLGKYNE